MCQFTEALEALTTCKIDTELVIPASPAQVWAVFGDFANWGQWNDFMTLPVSPKSVGKHCRVVFKLEGGLIRRSVHDPEVITYFATEFSVIYYHGSYLADAVTVAGAF